MDVLLVISLLLMPPNPDIVEKLKQEGLWNYTVNIIEDARKRGMDAPDVRLQEKTKGEILKARKNKTKVIKKAVVILADFSDNPGSTPPAHYDSLIFSENIFPTGSVRDFYHENSYGILDIQGEVTPVWVRLPEPYSYYTNGQYGMGRWPNNAQKMAYDAVIAADSLIDFSQYDLDGNGYVDAIIIIHAGPGAEATGDVNDIWSHAWVIPYPPTVDGVQVYSYTTDPENGGCGVIAHEFGHRPLGLPDLYDTDNSSEGLGNWSLMAAGSWNMNQTKPAHLDAWCKTKLGFVEVDTITSNMERIAIPAVEDTGLVFRLWTDGQGGDQYFLVENRRLKKFDVGLPGQGLLIYHVDDAQSNNRNEWYPGHTSSGHYMVALEQADGRWDMEKNENRGDGGDPFPGTTYNRHFDSYSTPDSKDYNFQITYIGVKNISDSQDTMWADLLVSPYENVRIDELIAERVIQPGDTVPIKGVLVNDGFGDLNVTYTLQVMNEDSSLIIDTTGSAFLAQGLVDTLEIVNFIPQLDDEDYLVNLEINDAPNSISHDNRKEIRVYSFHVKPEIWIPYFPDTVSRPTVDGVVDSLEYILSYSFDVSDVFDQSSMGSNYIIRGAYGFAEIVSDTLYLGFVLNADSTQDNLDRIYIDVDDDGSGSYPDTLGNEGEYFFYDGSVDLIQFKPYSSTGSGAAEVINIPFEYSVIDGVKHVEIAIPIVQSEFPVEAINISSIPCRFKLSIRITDGANGIGWYPQDMLDTREPSQFAYAYIIPSDVNETILSRKPRLMLKNCIVHDAIVFSLSLNAPTHYKVELYSIDGRKALVLKGTGSQGKNQLNIPVKSFPEGVYFFRFYLGGERVFKGKVVKIN